MTRITFDLHRLLQWPKQKSVKVAIYSQYHINNKKYTLGQGTSGDDHNPVLLLHFRVVTPENPGGALKHVCIAVLKSPLTGYTVIANSSSSTIPQSL